MVVNTIASHHGDVEPESVIAVIVAAADALVQLGLEQEVSHLKAASNACKILKKLQIVLKELKTSFALQAGREIRIMVSPEAIKDDKVTILAHDIREKIESNLEYPGNIKVTVIRELRAVDFAR